MNKECRRAASNASKLARADHYDNKVRRHYANNKLTQAERAVATCWAQELAEEAEKLRAEVANDRRQSPLSYDD